MDKFDPDYDEFAKEQLAQIHALAKVLEKPAPAPVQSPDVRLLLQLRYLAIDLDLSGNPDAEIVWLAYEKLGGVR